MTRESLMRHFEAPRNVGEIPAPDARARAGNPVCGDEVAATFRVVDGRVAEMRYRAFGCHATLGVMSLVSARVEGRSPGYAVALTPEEIMDWFDDFPAGKRHAAEIAVEILRSALGERA